MDVSEAISSSGTTTMLNNDIVVAAKFHMPQDIPASLTENAGTGYEQDIKSFLAKPIILESNSFSAVTISGVINSYSLPQDLFSKEVYKRKLQGYLGIRGKVVLRLQLNATKFQQGRLILAYSPVQNSDFQRLDSAMLVTQLPHVQLDIATQTEAILEIPFCSNYTHFGLVSGEGAWAEVYLYNYLPFRTGAGSTTCDYTIWAHMEDVELVTPTANKGYIAQMAGDRLKRVAVKNKEADLMSKGPVSKALSQLSSTAKILEGVPLLSSIAAPVAWATQIGSSIAAIFGWSKPMNELPNERRNITTNQYENNCDAVDNLYSLGLMTTNSVSILPGLGGTDADEMSMAFLNSVNFYWTTVTWSTSDAVGASILSCDLKPTQFARAGSSGLSNFGPISFFSTMFRYYRGSLKFRFKFAKTIFHSGRLVLAYVPGYNQNGTTNTVSLDESAYTYREILDMRDACEFEFTIPYASVRPYLAVDQPYGSWVLRVLNPLVAPDTVDTTVDIAVEVSGDKDFEFFDPQPPKYVPVIQIGVTAQSGNDRVATIHPHESGNIGSSQVTGSGVIASQLCVGERILSVKQLLSRACEMFSLFPQSLTSTYIRPFDLYNSIVASPFTGSAIVFNECDYFTLFSSFYRFSRGGVAIRYQMAVGYPASEGRYTVYKYNDDSSTATPPAPALGTCQSKVNEAVLTGNTVSVLVPMYHPTHTRVNCPHTKSTLILPTSRAVEPFSNSQVITITSTSGTPTGLPLRSVADDFQLGFFVGIPPMALQDNIRPA